MIILKMGSKLRLIVLIFFMALGSLGNIFTAFVIGNFMTVVTTENRSLFINNVLFAIFGYLFFFVIGALMEYFKTKYVEDVNVRIKGTIIKDTMYNSSYTMDSSEPLSMMTNELKLLETNGINSELAIIQNGLMFVFALSAALYLDIVTTLIYFIASLTPVVISKLTQNPIKIASEKWSQRNTSYTSKLKDYFSGIETIQTYNAEDTISQHANHEVGELEQTYQKMNQRVGFANQLTSKISMLAIIVMPFSFGVYRIVNEALTLGTFMAITQMSNYLVNPIIQILQMRNLLTTTKDIQRRVLSAKERVDTMPNLENNDHHLPDVRTLSLQDATIEINEEPILENLQLTIKEGEKILLMAPSGYGKSTLLRVLQNKIPLAQGEYTYNGVSVEQLNKNSYNNLFGLVQQNPVMFDDTIRFNITLGADYSEAEIEQAVERAGLNDVVEKKGLDYRIGEKGKNLSGGQLQRIEIARAFIRNRSVLLADEITASLDDTLSSRVRNTLLNSKLTLVEAAHKVTPEERAKYDQVIQLDKI